MKIFSKDRYKILPDSVNRYFKEVPIGFFKYGSFYLFMLMLFFMLLFSPAKEKKQLVCMEMGLLIFGSMTAYFFHAWQYNWMVFAVILQMLVPLLLSMEGARDEDCRNVWVYLAVLSVILYSRFSSQFATSVPNENIAETFADMDADQTNLIDLNAYLMRFPAQKAYPADILSAGNIRVSNGAYALMGGYDSVLLSTYAFDTYYEWYYNPREYDAVNLLLE